MPYHLGYTPKFMVHLGGFEPPAYGFEVRCSIHLSYRCKLTYLEQIKGIGPLTTSLEGWDSTIELHPHIHHSIFFMVEGTGFEPVKAQLTDLQSVPFTHSSIPPYVLNFYNKHISFRQRRIL